MLKQILTSDLDLPEHRWKMQIGSVTFIFKPRVVKEEAYYVFRALVSFVLRVIGRAFQ